MVLTCKVYRGNMKKTNESNNIKEVVDFINQVGSGMYAERPMTIKILLDDCL